MKLEAKASFHNRFDIEVIRDGKVINRGQAENIVLDRAWSRVCNFSSYFSQIHFGSGTGTLDPTRTTLFNRLGSKNCVDEEKIKAFPISKVTRKITLMPEEFVGQIITEVGISETSPAVNTHALIKDAEGNPLSITKTDLDVVIIYATVFIDILGLDSGANIAPVVDNGVLNYFLHNSAPSSSIFLGKSNKKNAYFNAIPLVSKNASISVDVSNRKRIYSQRFGVADGNSPIAEVGLSNIINYTLPHVGLFSSHTFIDKKIGVGDGTQMDFLLNDYNITDLVVRIDGNVISNYICHTVPFLYNLDALNNTPGLPGNNNSTTRGVMALNSTGEYVFFYRYNAGVCLAKWDLESDAWVLLSNRDIDYNWQNLQTSDKGLYVKASSNYYQYDENGVVTQVNFSEIPEDVVFDYRTSVGTRRLYATSAETIYKEDKLGDACTIKFTSPPAEGAVITADYTVPYIPKSEDYVLDVEFILQFGEGV